MTVQVLFAAHDLLCDSTDGCGGYLIGRHGETVDGLLKRAAGRGWWIFENRHICPRCADRWKDDD